MISTVLPLGHETVGWGTDGIHASLALPALSSAAFWARIPVRWRRTASG